MGTFTLIPPMSLGNLNKAEKLSLLKRYMKLMPSGSDSESPDEISLLADSGVPVLNISAGQVTRMNGIIDELTELTMQASSSEETPRLPRLRQPAHSAGDGGDQWPAYRPSEARVRRLGSHSATGTLHRRATTAQRSLCRAGRPTRQIEIGTHRECDLQGAVLRGARPAGRYVRTGQCLQPVATLGRGARICS